MVKTEVRQPRLQTATNSRVMNNVPVIGRQQQQQNQNMQPTHPSVVYMPQMTPQAAAYYGSNPPYFNPKHVSVEKFTTDNFKLTD